MNNQIGVTASIHQSSVTTNKYTPGILTRTKIRNPYILVFALRLVSNKVPIKERPWSANCAKLNKENSNIRNKKKLERVAGIEPASSAWKAEVISHYTIPAKEVALYIKLKAIS